MSKETIDNTAALIYAYQDLNWEDNPKEATKDVIEYISKFRKMIIELEDKNSLWANGRHYYCSVYYPYTSPFNVCIRCIVNEYRYKTKEILAGVDKEMQKQLKTSKDSRGGVITNMGI